MTQSSENVKANNYTLRAGKALLVNNDGSAVTTANPLPTTATISGDVNVDSTSLDTSGYIGKASGTNGDFTTAYLAGTTITLSVFPADVTSFTADDIVSVMQIATDGSVTETYTRDDAAMTMAADVLTVAGATFLGTDTFVIYTNVARPSGGNGSVGGSGIIVGAYANTGAYAFDASAQTVTITGLETLNINQILRIVNDTDGITLYESSNPSKTGTISGNVITLAFDTTGMADADSLTVRVDINPNNDYGLRSQKVINQSLDRSDYIDVQNVISSAQTLTASFVDIGGELYTMGMKKVILTGTHTIQQATNLQYKILRKDSSGGTTEMPIYGEDVVWSCEQSVVTAATKGTNGYYEFASDANSDWVVVITLDGCTPYIQVQGTETDGGTDATVDTLTMTGGF